MSKKKNTAHPKAHSTKCLLPAEAFRTADFEKCYSFFTCQKFQESLIAGSNLLSVERIPRNNKLNIESFDLRTDGG